MRAIRATDDNRNIVGQIGTVMRYVPDEEDMALCVEFDAYIHGHDGIHHGDDLRGISGNCWWTYEEDVVLLEVNHVSCKGGTASGL